MKLLISDAYFGIADLTGQEKKIIENKFTYKDISQAMTPNGFDERKVKKVKFAISKNNSLLLRSGFLQEFLSLVKEYSFKITEIKDKRTRYDFQKKDFSYDELKSYFNPNFKYIEHQTRSLKSLLKTNCGIIKAPTSAGKCFGKDTEILMYDGSIKKVQDVDIGDVIMGWDSTPRKVMSKTNGKDVLYKIKYLKSGGYHIVNSAHVLTLKSTKDLNETIKKNTVLDISIKDYLKQTKDFKRAMKLFQEPVLSWSEKKHILDPYFLGVWLGSEKSDNQSKTTNDDEIINYLYEHIKQFDGLSIFTHKQKYRRSNYVIARNKKQENQIIKEIKRLCLIGNKHIPKEFLIDSYENRLNLLAGLLDTSGYYNKLRNCFQFMNKNKQLVKDVVYLAKSLGFYVSDIKSKKLLQKGTSVAYQKFYIFGDIWKIPTKKKKKIKKEYKLKDPTKIEFKIEKLEEGDYFGFTLDGDGRFMLGDFIVSHNTEIIIGFIKISKLPVLILVDNITLAIQTRKRIEESGLSCGICTGKGKIQGTNMVSTIGSVKKLSLSQYQCVIVDECHIVGSSRFQEFFSKTNYPLRYGFSATPEGNDKYRFATIRQFIGNIISEIYTDELMENEVITPPEIHFKQINCIPTLDWQSAYETNIVKNYNRNLIAAEIANNSGVPTLVLYKIIEHGKELAKLIPDSILLSGDNNSSEREDAIRKFKEGDVRVIIASNIFKQGISINNIQTLINVSGGKSKIEVLQKIGRALRKHPGKNVALVYDFLDKGNDFTYRHSLQRIKLYKEAGYTNIIIDND